jgi:aspartate-semialdehyde dehydrogenase
MTEKISVAVLGATGSVGQRFVQLLDRHPWFEVVAVTGSPRTTGRRYGESCRWLLPEPMPGCVQQLTVLPTLPVIPDVRLVFSALPARVAANAEPEYARAGVMVCSNASTFRPEADVPLLLPEVNPEHTGLLTAQRALRGWSGGIVTNPNCTSTGLTIGLKALQDRFGLQKVFAVSMQAISGAGYPGVAALDIQGNVIPYISGEEEKVQWEPRKMLGAYVDGQVELADFSLSVHCNRVSVRDGHLLCLSVQLDRPADQEDVLLALADYQPPAAAAGLPSTPRPVIEVAVREDRPQPLLDGLAGDGMTTVIGRVRPDPILDWKLVVLSHNTIRGAAGGSIYNAELLKQQGWL